MNWKLHGANFINLRLKTELQKLPHEKLSIYSIYKNICIFYRVSPMYKRWPHTWTDDGCQLLPNLTFQMLKLVHLQPPLLESSYQPSWISNLQGVPYIVNLQWKFTTLTNKLNSSIAPVIMPLVLAHKPNNFLELKQYCPFFCNSILHMLYSRHLLARNKKSSVHDGEHHLLDNITVQKACCKLCICSTSVNLFY